MSAFAALMATPLLAVIALDDLCHRRIRNRYVLGLAAVAAAAVLTASVDGDSAAIARAALGAALAVAPVAAAWLAHPGRIGGGDVKLAATLGALVGGVEAWLGLAVVGIGLTGALVTALLLRRTHVALAPAMAVTAATTLVVISLPT